MKLSNRKDIILLLLYCPGDTKKYEEPILGRTRIMKLIYLFNKEIYKQFGFDKLIPGNKLAVFEPYKYGPFSVDVFSDLNFFENIKFIERKQEGETGTPVVDFEEFKRYLEEFIFDENDLTEEIATYNVEQFILTAVGKNFALRLFDSLNERQKEALANFKARYNSCTLNSLLSYVYKTYPEDASKSEIKDKIL